MDIEAIKERKRAWASALADEDEAKRWLDFYDKYWRTEEGFIHLHEIASGRRKSLDGESASD